MLTHFVSLQITSSTVASPAIRHHRVAIRRRVAIRHHRVATRNRAIQCRRVAIRRLRWAAVSRIHRAVIRPSALAVNRTRAAPFSRVSCRICRRRPEAAMEAATIRRIPK